MIDRPALSRTQSARRTAAAAHRGTRLRRSRSGPGRVVAVAAALAVALVGLPVTNPPAQAEPRTSITTLKVKSTPGKEKVDLPASTQRRQEQRGGKLRDRVVAELPQQATDHYSTVGVTWSQDSAGTAPEIQVRTKDAKDGWTDWATITDGAPLEGNGRYATDPIYVGDATGVQVRALGDTTTELQDVQVDLLESPVVAADRDLQTTATTTSGDLYPRPPIVTRRSWGANESWRCDERKLDETIKGAVVHHTAGSNSYSASESASIIRSIYAYHTQTLGWCDIGYNFLVDRYGTIFEGRRGGINLPVHGAHATAWNTDTIGISFMGNFETARPPAGMLEAGARLLAWKLDAFQRNAIGTVTLAGKKVNIIFGHGDVMATACPGKYIRAEMDDFRRNVQAKMGAHSPIYAAWQDRGGDSGFGSPYVGEVAIGSGRLVGFIRNGAFKNLYWHPSYDDALVYGSIRRRYLTIGGTSSVVGWPTSDEKDGPVSGSRLNTFTRGRIVWSHETGAWEIKGGFNALYGSLGSYTDDLGVPTSSEYWAGTGDGLIKQNFTKGRLYYRSGDGSHAVYGDIGKKYRALGEARSRLGIPTSSEYSIPGGRANNFEHGKITWSRTTHEVRVIYT